MSKKGLWIFVIAVLFLFSPFARALNVYVMRGGDAPSDAAVINALQERGHTATPGVETPEWDGTDANLNNFDAVVILQQANWPRPLNSEGVTAIRDYISNGGAVVTGEWFIWGVFARSVDILAPLIPIGEHCGWNFETSTTYAEITPDAIINSGLPSSFSFSLSNFSGTESCFREQAGAKVFYSSSNGGGQAGAPGLVGWDVESGRIASFSTLLGATELTTTDLRRLFVNTVEWAAQEGGPGVFQVGAVSPSKGGDTGSVSVLIDGSGFAEGATVRLVRAGEPDIVGDPVHVLEGRRAIATTFDLTGKARGLWDVVVTNPDGNSATLPEGFTIEEGRAAQPWVDIIGRDVIRVGREQTFNVVYGNRGNVDAVGVPLWIAGIPKDATVKLGFKITPPPLLAGQEPIDWPEVPIHIRTEDEIVLPLFVATIPAGYTGSLKLTLTVPTSEAFQLQAWVTSPFFQSPLDSSVLNCFKGLIAFGLEVALGEGCAAELTEATAAAEDLFLLLVSLPPPPPPPAFPILVADDGVTYELGRGSVYEPVFFSPQQAMIQPVRIAAECLVPVITKSRLLKAVRDIFKTLRDFSRGGELSLELAELFAKCKKQFEKIWEKTIAVLPVTSLDPNDKVGSQGAQEPRYLSGEEPLRYTIFFENVETATAPAQEVVISDQLDVTKLDLSTFSLGRIVFGNNEVVPPPALSGYTTEVDLRPEKNLIVKVNGSLDPNTGLLTWRFTSIDPDTGQLPEDPLAGFLPPNKTSPEGEGSVLFTVKPKVGLPTGTEVSNGASIVFDTNPAIDTPVWLNTLDNDKPTSQVQPLARTQASTNFEVRWLGTDVGAGAKDFTIFVSEDGGAFTPFLTNTPDASAVFTGQAGKTYAFYSVARDQTGNTEDVPTVPDTTTKVEAINQPPIANAGLDRTVRLGSLVTLDGSASSDPDIGPGALSFVWTQAAGPVVALTGETTASPTFTPNENGSYAFSLIVNDGQSDSAADTVAISVPILGDIDLDGDVDKNDLKLIRAALKKSADGPNDLRDLNDDGKITARDVLKAKRLCTRRRCATQG